MAIEENLACKLGFFLHIPFPSWDIMRLFPWDDQILEGILGNFFLVVFLMVVMPALAHSFYVAMAQKQLYFREQNWLLLRGETVS